jgi:hypothetical protein
VLYNTYISGGFAKYFRKNYRLKKGENGGRRNNERKNESKQQRHVTTGDGVV